MMGLLFNWFVVSRVTTVSVMVFFVIDSLNRPSSVGGGGNCNSLNLKSFGSLLTIEADDRRCGGGGGGRGDDGGDG